MKTVIRLEEFGMFLFSIYLFSLLGLPWWYFPALLFAPDVSLVGYMLGPRIGALLYNIIHHRALALMYFVAGTLLQLPILSLAGVMLFAHSSLDRVFGYGLKFADGFESTHLGRIGRNA